MPYNTTSFMILFYAFSNRWGTNISRCTLSELQKLLTPLLSSKEGLGVDFELIYFHPRDFFRQHIAYQNYSLILGLGDYYGQSTRIHLETQARNSYNNQPIYPFSPILLDLSLPNIDNLDSSIFKISSTMGSYNCNWIAYRTQLYLNQKKLTTSHLFFHLPQKSNATRLAVSILSLLSLNQLISV